MTALLFAPHDQKEQSVTRTQMSSIWRTRFSLPTLVPTSCVQVTPGTCAQMPAKGLGMGDGQLLLCQELKLTKINQQSKFIIQVFPYNLQAFNRLQRSKIVTSGRLRPCDCCLGGDIDPWCFLFCHLPRILSKVCVFYKDITQCTCTCTMPPNDTIVHPEKSKKLT